MAKDYAEISAQDKAIYRAGMSSRSLRKPKNPPGSLTPYQRSWWLAGWNDRDMEIESIYSGFRPSKGVGQPVQGVSGD